MKRITLLAILIATLKMTPVCGQENAGCDVSFYYFYNEKKEFSVIKDCVILFPEVSHDGTPTLSLQRILNLQKDYNFFFDEESIRRDDFSPFYPHNDVIVQVPIIIDPEEYDDIVKKLNADSRVRAVCNVIDSVYYLSRFVDVQLKEDIADEELYSFAKELNVNVFGPNEGRYTLETTSKSVGSSSFCAEKLYNSGLCQMVTQITFGLERISYLASVNNLESSNTSEFFNLQGQSVTVPVTPGIYIQKMSDGKVKKVLIQ